MECRLSQGSDGDQNVAYDPMTYRSYEPRGTGRHLGAGWALGAMPLLMLAVQYGLLVPLVKALHVSVPLGQSLGVLPVVCYFVGIVIVYLGTALILIGRARMVRRTLSMSESIEELARESARDGESFSATVARLIEQGARSESGARAPRYVAAGDGPADLGEAAEHYLREPVPAR